jgi:hypothetical protein
MAEAEALSFEVRVVFSLDRAFYSPVELEAERVEVQRNERRRAIERDVIEALVTMESERRASSTCAANGTSALTVGSVSRARALLEQWCGMDAEELRRRASR